MTTPAQDAPLVFPSVAFQPARLFVICLVLSGVVTGVAAYLGSPMFGAFFGIGMALGLINALLVRRAVLSITDKDHPLKSQMALNSATRLLVITVVGLVLAYVFRPTGLGVLFGLALFQVVLVASTSLPVLKKLRSGTDVDAELGDGTAPASNDGSASKD